MSKVKIVVNTPTKAPKPETVGKPKTPPMASDTMKKVKTRGTGAAIKGTNSHGLSYGSHNLCGYGNGCF